MHILVYVIGLYSECSFTLMEIRILHYLIHVLLKFIVYAKKWASDLEVFVLTKQLLFHDNSAG